MMPDSGALPAPAAIVAAMEATWPAAARIGCGAVTLRDGRGGGSRVSAATADTVPDAATLERAETAMRGLGQPPLFMIRDGDAALDAALAARGYVIQDPVALLWIALRPTPPAPATAHWPPETGQVALWAEAGIGAARLAIMQRAAAPKTALAIRDGAVVVGCGFVAIDRDLAMLHALEIAPRQRRRGFARAVVTAAMAWAADRGAGQLGLAVTRGNHGALALYRAIGFHEIAGYHYRRLDGGTA